MALGSSSTGDDMDGSRRVTPSLMGWERDRSRAMNASGVVPNWPKQFDHYFRQTAIVS